MNSRIILAVLTIAVLSSCSTAYKAQTPDDVYYSPARPQEEYVRVETQKDRNDYQPADDVYSEDRYLRWKVRNRTRWSSFDDYTYYDLYDYRYTNGVYWNRNNYYWNSYWSWNNYYNPYCTRVIAVNPKYNPVAYNQVRSYTPGTYKTSYSNSNNTYRPKTSPGVYRSTGSYNNSNSSSLGSSIKKVFSNSGNSNNNSSYPSDSRPNRTYTPSPSNNSSSSGSSSSSSGSSSGSGGGVSRPSRGG
jgi:hypothetical protein